MVELLECAGCLGPDGPVTLVNRTAAANGKMLTSDQQDGRQAMNATATAGSISCSSSSRRARQGVTEGASEEEEGWTVTYG